jgi:hypothetical protein
LIWILYSLLYLAPCSTLKMQNVGSCSCYLTLQKCILFLLEMWLANCIIKKISVPQYLPSSYNKNTSVEEPSNFDAVPYLTPVRYKVRLGYTILSKTTHELRAAPSSAPVPTKWCGSNQKKTRRFLIQLRNTKIHSCT